MAAAKLTTDVISTEAAAQVAAAKLTTNVISAEPSHVATTEAHLRQGNYVATPAKATAAACIRRVDTKAAAEDCER